MAPAGYKGNSPEDGPRDNDGHEPELVRPERQQRAWKARRQPRVSSLSMGAPPGMYESRYHATAIACSAEKRRTSTYECMTSAAYRVRAIEPT